ncbi:hypothetical protein [Polaromonas sp. UC242_47]|uniref:hypothetical protein n=1 Tax=Polaromonas sp. UC242_47 TaxID=3374626 RepID=UPI0037BC8824
MSNATSGAQRMNYVEARSHIKTGDLIALRTTHGGFPALVRWFTKSPYTHTAVALWMCDRLMMIETRIVAGIVPMSQLGDTDFDVIRCPVADPEYVFIEAFNILGTPINYDFIDLLRIAARLKLGWKAPDADDGRKVCSALSAAVYRLAGWNPAGLPGIPAPCEVVAAAGPVAIEVRNGG